MRILGVDPGLTRCGVGVIDVNNRRQGSFVAVNVLRTDPAAELADRLLSLEQQLDLFIDQHAPTVLAVERVFSQHNVRTAMGTAQASAVALLAAKRRGLDVTMYTPTEVKAAVTGSGRANKEQVTAMVMRILNVREPIKPADAADALALAICHGWRGIGQQRISQALAGVR